jgi:GT2 family glycosyltransferase
VVDGKFLRVNGERFWIRGVTYGTFRGNCRGELLPEPEVVRRDMEQMVTAGVNTVRTYITPPRWFLDLAQEHGLMVVAGIFWEARECLFDDPEALAAIEAQVAAEAAMIAGHPSLLMVCLGNEIPPLVARWHGKAKVERLLRRLRDRLKAIDPAMLLTYASYPPTEFLDLSFLDVIGFNVYLEREPEFRAYLARLQTLAGDRPLFLGELGLDSRRNGVEQQAATLEWQLRGVWEKGLAGAVVYAWTDEWAVAGRPVEDWDFGLVDRERRPKLALAAVTRMYRASRYDLRAPERGPWPRVTVVCCAYNAAATVGETLASLARLNYPDYEIILVDDGSRDGTAAVAQRFPCRIVRVENGGLSRARNLGIRAATGEIVAFIDADAYADPDWLYFLVAQIEAQGAAGCGGPNLSPPVDPEGAQRVNRAPGNPVHVLLDDERAEHIPGCNMAFRKATLAAIGGFDPVYTAAGDDVDVCWKVLDRGELLAFSPAAIVWHHRRPSTKVYLRQQRGYGFAEALLEARHPERFGLAGGATWRGRVYEGPQPAPGIWPARRWERVHHGAQGAGLFQSVYTLRAPWWLSLAAAPGFYLANATLAASSAWMHTARVPAWPLPAVLFLLGIAASAACCLEAGLRKCAGDELPAGERRRRVLGVAWLHFLQPWARALGRRTGKRQRAKGEEQTVRQPVALSPLPFARGERRLWAGWDRRQEWLARFEHLLREAGLTVQPGDEWGRWDLIARACSGHMVALESVVERETEIRFRARVCTPFWLSSLLAALVGLVALLVATPPLLPLALPVAALAVRLGQERARLAHVALALGEKAGKQIGLVPLEAGGVRRTRVPAPIRALHNRTLARRGDEG